MTIARSLARGLIACLLVSLAACGGGEGGEDSPAPAPAPAPPTPPAAAPAPGIGAAGGTVSNAGASVQVPVAALSQNTAIEIAQTNTGAPPLPNNVTPYGQMFAFTPHGTTFSSPVTVTVPFDAAAVPAGTTLKLLKTNAQNGWDIVAGATVSPNSVSAPVTSFSYMIVIVEPPAPVEALEHPWWNYSFNTFNYYHGRWMIQWAEERNEGFLFDAMPVGHLPIYPSPDDGPLALMQVYAERDGETYWASAQAPRSEYFPEQSGGVVGSMTQLGQQQRFVKNAANATLQAVISRTLLEALDSNNGYPTQFECPWIHTSGDVSTCKHVMWSNVEFRLNAMNDETGDVLIETGGTATLHGWQGVFDAQAYPVWYATTPLWTLDDFDFDPDVSGVGSGSHARLQLNDQKVIDIPLESVKEGEEFTVNVNIVVFATNRRQRESYLSAYLRDPMRTSGMSFTSAGVKRVATPKQPMPPISPRPAAPCTRGTDPAAGTIQFEVATLSTPELPSGAMLAVTRTGGNSGAVSASLATIAGTALEGDDYTPLTTHVLFADGEAGSRVVIVPIAGDNIAEPDETLSVRLSAPMGCAALGSQTTAVLTIADDDRPPQDDTFSVGGAASGLPGSGLVLDERVTGAQVSPAADGPFTFDYDYPDGSQYDIRVRMQPEGAICTVANAVGSVAGADVTNVSVTCAPEQVNGALDPTFGSNGKVSGDLSGGASGIALQSDGKLLVLGARSLLRYDGDGSPDTSFGSNGAVALPFNDEAHALLLQDDGRIVVAGVTRVGAQKDFAVARFDATGALDATFGTSGTTTVDFNGLHDEAWSVLRDGAGNIVIAGHAGVISQGSPANDYAVARLTASGALDSTFGSGGKVMTDIAGQTDLAHAAALQSDGRIVLVGRAGATGGATPDVGIVRYLADGTLDTSFNSSGRLRIDLANGGWDEAADVEVLPDGKIVVAVQAQPAASFDYMLARFNADGSLDSSFAGTGVAVTAITADADYARALVLKPNGGIVLAGQIASDTVADFGLVSYNPDGSLDTDFGENGIVAIDFFGAIDAATSLALRSDGKLIVAGLARNGSTNGLGIARVSP